MAKPQLEGGYTRIANELLEAIMRYRFIGYELKIILTIIRLTYGWHKTSSEISYGTIARLTGCEKRQARRCCNELKKKNVIFILPGAGRFLTNVISINKNFEEWKCFPVDNFSGVGVSAPSPLGVPAPSGNGLGRGQGTPTPRGVRTLPLNKLKESFKETGKKGAQLVEKTGKQKQKSKAAFAELVDGYEEYVTANNPKKLVNHLAEAGYDAYHVWAAIVQARHKKPDPVGYFVSIMTDKKFAISDAAYQQSKIEMRRYEF